MKYLLSFLLFFISITSYSQHFCGNHNEYSIVEQSQLLDQSLAEPKRYTHIPKHVEFKSFVQDVNFCFISFDFDLQETTDFVYSIGSKKGYSDLKYWQLFKSFTTPGVNKKVIEQDTFYINIKPYLVGFEYDTLSYEVIKEVPLRSDTATFDIKFSEYGYDVLGNPIDGYSDTYKADVLEFVDSLENYIYDYLGRPYYDNFEVTLVNNQAYTSSNIYRYQINQIHGAETPKVNYFLLIHEIAHMIGDDMIVTVDSLGYYDSLLSGFEEGFAHGGTLKVLYHYLKDNPNTKFYNQSYLNLNGASRLDLSNDSALATGDFWTSLGGNGIENERYNQSGLYIFKMLQESPKMLSEFRYFWNDGTFFGRNDVIDVLSNSCPTVENEKLRSYIDKLYVFKCQYFYGPKVWVKKQDYVLDGYNLICNIYKYKTFKNGSDWYYYSKEDSAYVYYSGNGETLRLTVKGETITDTIPSGNRGFGSLPYVFGNSGDRAKKYFKGRDFKYVDLPTGLNRFYIDGKRYTVFTDSLRSDSTYISGVARFPKGVLLMEYNGEKHITMITNSYFSYALPKQFLDGKAKFTYFSCTGKQLYFERNLFGGEINTSSVFLYLKRRRLNF